MISDLRISLTSEYLAGAAVTLHSFRQHNPWFDGTATAYCPADDVDSLASKVISIGFDEVRAIPHELTSRVREACDLDIWVPARFNSLAMLAEPSDHDVLLLDADLLFRGSCESLRDLPGSVVACPEGAAYKGWGVDRATNAFIENMPNGEAIERTFNSGLLRIGAGVLGPHLFRQAMELINRDTLDQLVRRQHDQFVLNRLFEGIWTEAGPVYNYLMGHADLIMDSTGIRMDSARVLHFNTSPRPWDLPTTAESLTPRLARAGAEWLRCFAEVVEAQPLRALR
jgi:hypothetical protein